MNALSCYLDHCRHYSLQIFSYFVEIAHINHQTLVFMRSLPFYVDDLNGGFMKLEGILRLEEGQLIFEYQKKDAILEAYKSALTTVEIPVTDLAMTEFKKGWFSAKLTLHADRPAVFADLPGNELTTRVLKLKKKHAEIAAKISSSVNLQLSQYRLQQMEDSNE